MKTFQKLLLVSTISAVVSGCSGIGSWMSSDVDSKSPNEKVSEVKPSNDTSPASKSEIAISKKQISLSEEVVERVPNWMKINDRSDLYWSSFKLDRGISLEESLIRNGVSPSFLDDIRRSDYINLSTFYQGQEVWVAKNKNGSLKSFYTSPENSVWFYIEITNRGPIVRDDITPIDQIKYVFLTPDTNTDSLSTSQRLAVSTFLSDISDSMNHETRVMLSKGNVKIKYQQTQLTDSSFGRIEILRASSEFSNHIMTYVPEKS